MVTALAAAALAGGGPAAAAAHRDNTGVAHAGTAAGGTISTVAGGVSGVAKATAIGLRPLALAFGAGRAYVSDDGAIRAVRFSRGGLRTPVGTRAAGPLGDGGPATQASLSATVLGLAVDRSHNLVIADSGNNRIRVVTEKTGTFYGRAMTAGHIYTVAGNGTPGGSGDGGPATSAELSNPAGVAVDAHGNLIVADNGNHEIRVVAARTGTFYGKAMTAGNIYTIAAPPQVGGSNFVPAGVAVDAAGNAVVSDYGQDHIWVVAARTGTFYGQAMTAGHSYTVAGNGTEGFSGDGGPALSAEISVPQGVTVDSHGNLLFADSANNRVRVVAASTGTFYGQNMTAGDIYTIAGTGARGYSGNAGPATSAKLDAPDGVAVDTVGNVLIADAGNNRVRVVASGSRSYGQIMTPGDIYTIAGNGAQFYSDDGGPANGAEIDAQGVVAQDAQGNLLIADTGNERIRLVPASSGTFYGREPLSAGHIYSLVGNGTRGFSGDGGYGGRAELNGPQSVAVDAHGNLLIADSGNNRVRVMAASNGTFYGRAMSADDVYTIAGNGHHGFSGDGGPATSAAISSPDGATADAAGNVLIADTGNNRVRVVAASNGTFYGIAMTAGHIYTIAGNGTAGFSGDGGPATGAELDGLRSLAVDAAGNVLLADSYNNRVRVVAASNGTFYGIAMTAGHIYTIAGNGGGGSLGGFSGDGGPATSAELSHPSGVTVTPAGNVLITDAGNHRIRMITG